MRTAVLLLALVAVLYAKVFKIETYNAGSNRARLIKFENKSSSIKKSVISGRDYIKTTSMKRIS